jgi:hypothetical protein
LLIAEEAGHGGSELIERVVSATDRFAASGV